MDLAGLATLLTPEGWSLLEALPPYDEETAIRLGEHLRAEGHDAVTVAAALTQSRLRRRGQAKFGAFAAGMLFTSDGLEQATRLEVAARHAQRYVSAGIERVLDLGCGIGSDAMALASFEREVVAVDQDELTAAVATVNLRHWSGASVRVGDVTALDLAELGAFTPGTGVWLDPGRRTPGRTNAAGSTKRVSDPEAFAPPWSYVRSVAARVPATGVKLPPGIAHRHLPDPDPGADSGVTETVEAQWVSVGGEAVECTVWWGLLAREDVRRSALVLGPDGAAELQQPVGAPAAGLTTAAPGAVRAGAWLLEPDAAVIAAGLVPHLANTLEAQGLSRGPTYLVTDVAAATPFARRYAVEDVMPFQLKSLRAYLRERGVGRLTIKKRGVAVEPEQLRRQLRPTGDGEATIAVTRIGGAQMVLVLRPAP
jgi:THUMP domain-like